MNYFEKKAITQREQEKYFHEKTNLRLKYAALTGVGISIFLMLAIIFGIVDYNNTTAILLMQGFAGLFAIMFVVLVAILLYRVNNSYHKDKARKRHIKNEDR